MATKQRSEPQPPALKPEHIAALHEIVAEHAQASLEEIADELDHRRGLRVCTATIRRTLRAQGIVRLKATRRVSPTADKGPKRYGYTAAHRREDVPLYSTNLTNAEWDLVADLFERAPGQRGTPAHYSRRELVNACSYVLRTGCAWRLLPTTFPPWQAIYKAFTRWAAAGVFEQMQDRLCEQWRSRIGREDARLQPSSMLSPIAARRKAAKAASMLARKGQRTQAQPCGRYDGSGDCSDSDRRQRAGSRRRCRSCRTSVRQGAGAPKALYRWRLCRSVCSRHRAAAPYPCRGRTAPREWHDGNLAYGRARDSAGCRNQQRGCGHAQSAGLLNGPMNGPNAGVAR